MKALIQTRIAAPLVLTLAAGLLGGCSTFGAAGPSTRDIRAAESTDEAGSDILVVDLDRPVTGRIADLMQQRSFANVFGDAAANPPLIQRGDLVAVTLWEAPPAVLFGAAGGDGSRADAMRGASTTLPDQRVDEDGAIAVPFAGRVQVTGRTPAQVQREIVARLRGKAHDPQAVVRLVDNQSSNVTILGEVATSRRVPLSARGERLLDVLAQAGGPTEDVDKVTIRLARGNRSETMPLEAVILDPAQNVPLLADDVVTVIHQPYSFIALGAVQRNAEVPFEGGGLSLAQALGRIGGLRDDRSDIRGVFVFRFEDSGALPPELRASARETRDGRVPVIYRLDLSEPAGLFVAQDFAMRDEDVLYVSNAPGADLQRFVATLTSFALSSVAIGNSL